MLSIRPAAAEDAPLLRTMICELADFERELDLTASCDTPVSFLSTARGRDGNCFLRTCSCGYNSEAKGLDERCWVA